MNIAILDISQLPIAFGENTVMAFSGLAVLSLLLPFFAVQLAKAAIRTATRWTEPGPMIRLHAGLEDPDDLIRDLERAFARLAAAL